MTIRPPTGLAGVDRRTLLTGTAARAAAAGLAYLRHVFSQTEKNHPLAGKSIRMAILGIAVWLPSKLGVDMPPDFAKARYGCDVSFSFADAPFGQLFKAARARHAFPRWASARSSRRLTHRVSAMAAWPFGSGRVRVRPGRGTAAVHNSR